MTTIILGIGLSVSILIIIFLVVKNSKLKKSTQAQLDRALRTYKDKINDLEAEIKRLNYLIEQYKTQKSLQTEELDLTQTNIDIKSLIAEKQRLEQEKQNLKEKTKKLWEQSLAIHKEKERIDRLRREIESRHKEITDSINYASRIQTALLPKDSDFQKVFKDYFILWKPREVVSGDFYWLRTIGNKTFLVAADCTGHGVPGAFMSLLGISFLNEIVNAKPYIEAKEILEELRQKVIKALGETGGESQPKDGMDMALVIIDHDKETMEFSGANNPAYIIRNGELIELKAVRAPIGYYRKLKPFTTETIELEPNDTIYLFSDGFSDQFGGPDGHSKFTKKRFKQMFIELNSVQIPLAEQKKLIWEIFEKWKGNNRQIDDVMIISIRW